MEILSGKTAFVLFVDLRNELNSLKHEICFVNKYIQHCMVKGNRSNLYLFDQPKLKDMFSTKNKTKQNKKKDKFATSLVKVSTNILHMLLKIRKM